MKGFKERMICERIIGHSRSNKWNWKNQQVDLESNKWKKVMQQVERRKMQQVEKGNATSGKEKNVTGVF